MTDTVIRVEDLGKQYLIGHIGQSERRPVLRDVLARGAHNIWKKLAGAARGRAVVAGNSVEEFWALRDVNFAVSQGEVIGVIGRNGAGKSTLLKILSRVTEPSHGRATISGRVASLLEVGTGFHSELTGRENIYLNGAILGMTRAEIRRRFEDIVAFSGVDQFLDTPVKRYSSGMYVRLAFAVAAHLEPQIMIIDEVLAVGDAEFQKKCLGKVTEVTKSGGRTVLFVSHNMYAIEQLCHRVLVLDHGRVQGLYSNVREGIAAYLGSNSDMPSQRRWANVGGQCQNPYFVPQTLEVASANATLQNADTFPNYEPVTITVTGDVLRVDPRLSVGVAVYDDGGQPLFWSFMNDREEKDWARLPLGHARLRTILPAHFLNEGTYRVSVIVDLRNHDWLIPPRVGNVAEVVFSIQGGLSKSPLWTRRRPGTLAPVLPWENW